MKSQVPLLVQQKLLNLSDTEKSVYYELYNRKKKSIFVAYLLLFFFGWHYGYIKKWGLQIAFITTLGGLMLWWLIDWFRLPSLINSYNKELSLSLLKQFNSNNFENDSNKSSNVGSSIRIQETTQDSKNVNRYSSKVKALTLTFFLLAVVLLFTYNKLPSSILPTKIDNNQNSQKSILYWETENYFIAIDKLNKNTYQYSSWNKEKSLSKNPDLVLSNGEYVADGQLGNHYYIFKSGEFAYKCYVNVLNKNYPKGHITVYRDSEEILKEDVIENSELIPHQNMAEKNLDNQYYSTTTLNVRSGAGTKYPVLFVLNKGDNVELISNHSRWFKINFEGDIGYVSGKYLKPKSSIKEKNSSVIGELNPYLYISGTIVLLSILLAFVLKKSALKNYGSIIVLLATFFYYFFGLITNILFVSIIESPIAAGTDFWIMFFTFLLMLIVGILSIIGFFKNIGFGIIVLSSIVIFLDYTSGAIPGVIIASITLFGGILITIGYRQISVV